MYLKVNKNAYAKITKYDPVILFIKINLREQSEKIKLCTNGYSLSQFLKWRTKITFQI